MRSSELCYAPVSAVVTQSSAILGRDGCLNFFAGPTDKKFSAEMNFYDVHYNSTHVMGTTGGNTADMIGSRDNTEPSEDPGWKEINLYTFNCKLYHRKIRTVRVFRSRQDPGF